MGALVLRKLDATENRVGQEKLTPIWERLFKIIKMVRPGVFHLEDISEKRELHT